MQHLTPEDVVTVDLRETRFGDRYRESSVDSLLDDVVAAMRNGTLSTALLEGRTFERCGPGRLGYRADEVDALMSPLRAQARGAT